MKRMVEWSETNTKVTIKIKQLLFIIFIKLILVPNFVDARTAENTDGNSLLLLDP